jgi:hypothetical protein
LQDDSFSSRQSLSLLLLFRPRDFDRIGHLGVIERDKKKSRSAKQKREIAQSVCVLFCCVLCVLRADTGVVRRRIALGGFVDFGSSLEYISIG